MNIKFGHKKLGKLANDPRKCKQEMGDRRATLFFKRLTDLRDAETLEDVKYLPGRYHELKDHAKDNGLATSTILIVLFLYRKKIRFQRTRMANIFGLKF